VIDSDSGRNSIPATDTSKFASVAITQQIFLSGTHRGRSHIAAPIVLGPFINKRLGCRDGKP
jgi:hypothetical protein